MANTRPKRRYINEEQLDRDVMKYDTLTILAVQYDMSDSSMRRTLKDRYGHTGIKKCRAKIREREIIEEEYTHRVEGTTEFMQRPQTTSLIARCNYENPSINFCRLWKIWGENY